jgi:hypothetical protein
MSIARVALALTVLAVLAGALLGGCAPRAGAELERRGDEIVVAGRMFHTGGAPVVLWSDPGGYDAYRTEKRFVPWPRAAYSPPKEKGDDGVSSPNRYGVRFAPRPPFKEGQELDYAPLTADEFERVRGGGWDLGLLREHVDQFVLHYDVCGVSRVCFKTLHDSRGLSVHFMLDIDGTIYQTMDVKERAWHATIANDRSVGVEIANVGAYARTENDALLRTWYEPDPPPWEASADPAIASRLPPTTITVPATLGDGGLRAPGTYAPAWPLPIFGPVQGRELRQYDLTPEQYRSLIKLTATLHRALPKIALDYPRDERGRLVTSALPRERWERFQGVLGHHHIQKDKSDPGPALHWDMVINGARRELGMPELPPGGDEARYLTPTSQAPANPAPQ